jgi:hypothetical protein
MVENPGHGVQDKRAGTSQSWFDLCSSQKFLLFIALDVAIKAFRVKKVTVYYQLGDRNEK